MRNLDLNYEGFENYLFSKEYDMGGVLYRFKFNNNFGASVIKHDYSYGQEEDLWELGVLMFGDGYLERGVLTYDTPITNDIIPWLTDEEVRNLLERIKGL